MKKWILYVSLVILLVMCGREQIYGGETNIDYGEQSEESAYGSTDIEVMDDPEHSDAHPPVITWKYEDDQLIDANDLYLGRDTAGLCIDITESEENDMGIAQCEVVVEDMEGGMISKSGEYEEDGHRKESIIIEEKEWLSLGDGQIKIVVTAKDRVGNEVKEERYFVLDTRAPEIVLLCNDPEGMQSMQGEIAFYANDIQFTAFIREENPKPETYSIKLFYSEDGEENSYIEVKNKDLWTREERNASKKEITISAGVDPDGYYKLIVAGEDLAGNRTVIESPIRVLETVKPVVKIAPVTKSAANANDGRKLFAGDVKFAVDVSELYENSAGIYQITYDLKANGEYLFRGRSLYQWVNAADTKEYDPELMKPTVIHTGYIVIPANGSTESDQLEIIVHARDRAGNESGTTVDSRCAFGIDTTGPVIYVDVSNDDVRNEKYFKAGRTAVVREYELNSSGKIDIKADGAVIGNMRTVDTELGVATEATVLFEEDGEYHLEVRGADALGNPAKVVYRGVVPTDFCIDTTAPLIKVSYDNNDARNEKFYSSPRMATIQIIDANPQMSAVKLAVNGEEYSGAMFRPSESADMQLFFGRDGTYQIIMRCEDLAGNQSEIYRGERFIIDTKPPIIRKTIDTAQEEDRDFDENIVITDLHLDETRSEVVSLNRTTGARAEIFQRMESVEGQQSIFAGMSIPRSRLWDGMYVVTAVAEDLAGNQAVERYESAVDRFGPTYIVEEGSDLYETLQGGYYNGGALTLLERSISGIKDRSLYLYKGTTGKLLREGSDYETDVIREDGLYLTKITMREELFEEDGEYRIVPAASEKSNIQELSFTTDRTAPTAVITGIDADNHGFIADQIQFFVVPYDNHKLQEVSIRVSSRDGEILQETRMVGEELIDFLNNNGGKIPVTAYENSQEQFLELAVMDEAGNRSDVMNRSEHTAYAFTVGETKQVYYIQIIILLGLAIATVYIIGFTKAL